MEEDDAGEHRQGRILLLRQNHRRVQQRYLEIEIIDKQPRCECTGVFDKPRTLMADGTSRHDIPSAMGVLRFKVLLAIFFLMPRA